MRVVEGVAFLLGIVQEQVDQVVAVTAELELETETLEQLTLEAVLEAVLTEQAEQLVDLV
jgi:hypothetical protein